MKFQDKLPQTENGTGSIPIGEISDITTEPTTQTEDKTEVPVQGGAQPTQDRPHKLWLPEKQPHLADLVLALKRAKQQQQTSVAATPLQELETQTISSLKTRQHLLMERIRATQAVLPQRIYKHQLEDEAKPDEGNASRRRFARQETVSDDVSEYLRRREGSAPDIASTIQGTSEAVTPSVPIAEPVLRFDSQLSSGPSVKCGSMSLSKWREIVKTNKPYFSSVDSEDGLKDSSQYTHID